jgi:hypothetical protein
VEAVHREDVERDVEKLAATARRGEASRHGCATVTEPVGQESAGRLANSCV